MADIRPFTAIRYTKAGGDPSSLVAPPYDVLDEAAKAKLLKSNPNNIVAVDLPFMPPKSVGPDEVYLQSNQTLMRQMADGILARDRRPAVYPYTQIFEHHGRSIHRRGFLCLVRLEAFSTPQNPTDIIPHEKTHSGPIEDRLKLLRSTAAQLSPIFGLFSDPGGQVNKLLYSQVGRPQFEATLDGVRHQLWSVTDAEIERQIIDNLKARKIYIADGHHRYTTALHFKTELEKQLATTLPPDHPANFCLFTLVPMQDDGCIILPTHRLIGGLKSFDIAELKAAVSGKFEIKSSPFDDRHMHAFDQALAAEPPHTFGLFDGTTRKIHTLRLLDPDILRPLEPTQSDDWRQLDVAILHRYLLDEVIAPRFAGTSEIKRAYSHDARAIAQHVTGDRFQLGLLLRPTPLKALEALGKTGEVMPQKSTFFFPKLATGMVIYPLA